MPIQVTARDDAVGDDMKDYAREKAEKLYKFFNGIRRVELILGTNGLKQRAEVVVTLVGTEPFAHHVDHEKMHAAIDLAIDHVKRHVVRYKEKLRGHRGPAAPTAPAADSEEGLDSYQDIIEKTDFEE
ncbi:MAG: ribosome-associated translation inhibitor RaiA [Planctomycetes bacterium]|nr:ribosome-associated translation inhibitor RaiA [Planctomycetota bacterium]